MALRRVDSQRLPMHRLWLLFLLSLLPSLGALDAQAPEREAIDRALDLGGEFLAERFPPAKPPTARVKERETHGMRALVLYALLATGADSDHPSVTRLLRGLAGEPTEHTYDAACLILALAKLDPYAHLAWIGRLATQLVSWQEESGDWAYPGGPVIDLSNTQYAALGLWKAASLGIDVPEELWRKLVDATFRYQGEDGGFSYLAPGKDSTGSMTTAGLAILTIAELELRRKGSFPPELEHQVNSSVERARAWMRKHWSIDTNPRSGGWHYYYLYGLERVGGIAGIDHLDEHDWYAEGARWLVERQAEDGSWNHGTDLSETAFAILFLERATAPNRGPRQPMSADATAASGKPESADVVLGVGQPPGGPPEPDDGSVHVWVRDFRPASVERIEWPNERGLGPRVTRVEYSIGNRLVGVVKGDPTKPSRGARFGLRLYLPNAGANDVTARVFCVPPPTLSKELYVLDEATIEVDVARPRPLWAQHLTAHGPFAVREVKPGAKASSTIRGKRFEPAGDYAAKFAADGVLGTPWLSKAGVPDAWLRVTYKKPKLATAIRVHLASLPGFRVPTLVRPGEVELLVNGETVVTFSNPAPGAPMEYRLPESVRVKRVEVRLSKIPELAEAVVGIGEVELFLER